jgi:hypothetical protein
MPARQSPRDHLERFFVVAQIRAKPPSSPTPVASLRRGHLQSE